MLRRRLLRLITASFAVLSLLFAQLALASYVCPLQADAAAMAPMMDAGGPCADMDEQQPALCHQHCAEPAKTFEAVKLPVAGLPAVIRVLELPLRLDDLLVRSLPPAATPETRPPPDPLFLSTLRLRV